jgi:hypothetical protein
MAESHPTAIAQEDPINAPSVIAISIRVKISSSQDKRKCLFEAILQKLRDCFKFMANLKQDNNLQDCGGGRA